MSDQYFITDTGTPGPDRYEIISAPEEDPPERIRWMGWDHNAAVRVINWLRDVDARGS